MAEREQRPREAMPGRAVSPWLDRPAGPEHPPPDADLDVDVAVVGAGIVGLTTALTLQEGGAEVAVLEARRVGSGVSGNTTAKLSSLHGLSYDAIRSNHGAEAATVYAVANEWGLERVRDLAERLEIECDLRTKLNHTYTEDGGRLGEIESEVEAADAAGLAVSFTTETELPFDVAGAVALPEQAEFDPVKYLRGIAAALERAGGRLFESTRVVGVDGVGVRTAAGRSIRAERVVIATQIPFLDRGLFFARAGVKRSYAVTARLTNEPELAMYLQAEAPGRSLRTMPWGDEELLIVGGESHELGSGEATEKFKALERYARERFDVAGFEHRWSAHDFMPDDGLPYIGRLWPTSDRVLTTTGLRKWGLAMGTAAARIMADQALGQENEWASTFDPSRLPTVRALPTMLEHNAKSGFRLLADRAHRGGEVGDLAPGQGRVIGDGLRQKAVHRDLDGRLHAVSARCTHLGCIVRWNEAEATWDCPCHGSRFEADGALANGPATAPLEPEQPPAAS